MGGGWFQIQEHLRKEDCVESCHVVGLEPLVEKEKETGGRAGGSGHGDVEVSDQDGQNQT